MGFLEQLFSRPDDVKPAAESAPAPAPAPEPLSEAADKAADPVPSVRFRKFTGAPFIATLRPITLAATVGAEPPSAAHAPASDGTAVRPVLPQPPHVRPVVVKPAVAGEDEGGMSGGLESFFAMTERPDVAKIAMRVAEWPSIRACVIWTETETAQSGRFPQGFDTSGVRAKVAALFSSAAELGAATEIQEAEGITIHGAGHDSAVFVNGAAAIFVIVDGGAGLQPNVRERLARVARVIATIGR